MTEQSSRPGYASRGFNAFLATSFLGAFNDNFFKLLVTCFALSCLSSSSAQNVYVPLAGAMFVLPYLVCSGFAGYLSDRFSKKHVLIWSKWLELFVMLAGVLAFQCRAVNTLLAVLFFMGAQSALYSPAKYGYLPETLKESELPNGNGMTQLSTFIAIIAGCWVGGVISKRFASNWAIGSLFCVAAAAVGVFTSYFVSATPAGRAETKLRVDPVLAHFATLKKIKSNRLLLISMAGNSFFWFIASLFQNNMSLFVKNDMGRDEDVLGMLLGAVGLGIGIGCMACGALSRKRIEYGFILPGGIMTGLSVVVMGCCTSGSAAGAIVCSMLVGIFAGIYQLPLSASVQKHSPEELRGACISLGNAMDSIAMLLAYAIQLLLLKRLGMSPGGVFVALGVLTLLGMGALAWISPDFLRRSFALLSGKRDK